MRIAQIEALGRASAFAAALGVTLMAPTDAAADPTTTGWLLGAAPGKAEAGRGYRLFNVYNKLYLDVRAGKSPRVDTSALPVASVELIPRKAGELRCGDPFTLRVAGHTLVLDTKRGEVVPTPNGAAEEWKILGCKVGASLPLGRPVALVNMKRNDAWVGCKHHGAPTYCWDDKQLMGIATE